MSDKKSYPPTGVTMEKPARWILFALILVFALILIPYQVISYRQASAECQALVCSGPTRTYRDI